MDARKINRSVVVGCAIAAVCTMGVVSCVEKHLAIGNKVKLAETRDLSACSPIGTALDAVEDDTVLRTIYSCPDEKIHIR